MVREPVAKRKGSIHVVKNKRTWLFFLFVARRLCQAIKQLHRINMNIRDVNHSLRRVCMYILWPFYHANSFHFKDIKEATVKQTYLSNTWPTECVIVELAFTCIWFEWDLELWPIGASCVRGSRLTFCATHVENLFVPELQHFLSLKYIET